MSKPARCWTFTINNYTDEECEFLQDRFQHLCVKLFVSKEVGEEGTPHLQGYFSLRTSKRLAGLKKLLPRAHLEVAKGDWKDNICYVFKVGSEEFIRIDHGIQGKRNDISDWVDTARRSGFKHAMEEDPQTYVTHHQGLEKLIYKTRKIEDQPEVPAAARQWFEETFPDKDNADPRKIHWVFDPVGGWGKSALATHIVDNYAGTIFAGKTADIAMAIKGWIVENGRDPQFCLFDVPRSTDDYINYQAIEKLKDGAIVSTKWDSQLVRFKRPHVIVFANCVPEPGKFSEDRIVLHTVS